MSATIPSKQALPKHTLGADLVWWRRAQGMRTSVAILWPPTWPASHPMRLLAILFDAAGAESARQEFRLQPGSPLYLDSSLAGPLGGGPAEDGVLALYVVPESATPDRPTHAYRRLYPIVDWQSPDGRIASLHSDQVVVRGDRSRQRITEIVVRERPDERNALVFLNGEEQQAPGALRVTVRNASGAARSQAYAPTMAPFTVQRVPLAELFPGLNDFAAGEPLLVDAEFDSVGLFSRPYVETCDGAWGLHHAGNLYDWPELPFPAHALIGGEVNPVAVRTGPGISTTVNLLHSHGSLEADQEVDVRLFDAVGRCVTSRDRWLLLPRNGLASFDVSELLEGEAVEFDGHVALSFPVRQGRSVPRRLQALLEYRSLGSVARVMAWSDEWNSAVRLARRDRAEQQVLGRAYFRVREDDLYATQVAITNAGHAGYDRVAKVVVSLYGEQFLGRTNLEIAPFATLTATVCELFPGLLPALAGGPGMLLVESESDLASMAFTQNRHTGAFAAEHFMPAPTEVDGELTWPAGH